MKYISEFYDKRIAAGLSGAIKKIAPARELNFMDVCGTHTMSIAREGIKDLLPANINLISGPGCPVCVTPDEDIDRVIGISGQKSKFGQLFMSHPPLEERIEALRAAR